MVLIGPRTPYSRIIGEAMKNEHPAMVSEIRIQSGAVNRWLLPGPLFATLIALLFATRMTLGRVQSFVQTSGSSPSKTHCSNSRITLFIIKAYQSKSRHQSTQRSSVCIQTQETKTVDSPSLCLSSRHLIRPSGLVNKSAKLSYVFTYLKITLPRFAHVTARWCIMSTCLQRLTLDCVLNKHLSITGFLHDQNVEDQQSAKVLSLRQLSGSDGVIPLLQRLQAVERKGRRQGKRDNLILFKELLKEWATKAGRSQSQIQSYWERICEGYAV
eukprot:357556-Chlamydomonas_euryale.AAC.3